MNSGASGQFSTGFEFFVTVFLLIWWVILRICLNVWAILQI